MKWTKFWWATLPPLLSAQKDQLPDSLSQQPIRLHAPPDISVASALAPETPHDAAPLPPPAQHHRQLLQPPGAPPASPALPPVAHDGSASPTPGDTSDKSATAVGAVKSESASAIASDSAAAGAAAAASPPSVSAKLWQGRRAALHPESVYRKAEPCSAVIKDLQWDEDHPHSLSEAALMGLVRALAESEPSGVDDSKDVLAQLSLLQDHYHRDVSSAVVTRFARCEVVPGYAFVQRLVRWGDMVALEHPMARSFWTAWLKGRKAHELLDPEGNNVLHLAVLSGSPGMVTLLLQRLDARHGSVVAEALLTAGNAAGRTPIQLVDEIAPSQQSGMRAQLKRAHRLVTLHNQNLKMNAKLKSEAAALLGAPKEAKHGEEEFRFSGDRGGGVVREEGRGETPDIQPLGAANKTSDGKANREADTPHGDGEREGDEIQRRNDADRSDEP